MAHSQGFSSAEQECHAPLFPAAADLVAMSQVPGSLILALSLAQPAIAREPMIEMAMKAEAPDLLTAYLNAGMMAEPSNEWRAEADETENYTYAIPLQNET